MAALGSSEGQPARQDSEGSALPGMENVFYRERINQHLLIGIEAIRILRDEVGPDQLHSRKLRSFDEPAFR
jgi:AMP nucleosidase